MVANIFQAPIDSSLLNSIRSNLVGDIFAQDVLNHITLDLGSSSRSSNIRKYYDQFCSTHWFSFSKQSYICS